MSSNQAENLAYIDEAAAECAEATRTKKPTYHIEETHLDVGQFVAQGDVALVKLDKIPEGATRIEHPSAQIAPGTTQGSRHIWDSMDGVEVYELKGQDALHGNVYVLRKERTLTHPEHGEHTYHAGFIGQCIYQRAAKEELSRIQD